MYKLKFSLSCFGKNCIYLPAVLVFIPFLREGFILCESSLKLFLLVGIHPYIFLFLVLEFRRTAFW